MHWSYAFVSVCWQSQCLDAFLIFKRILTQAGCTNVAIYTCTKFAVRFVYVDTKSSVCTCQILYVKLIDSDQVGSLVLFN